MHISPGPLAQAITFRAFGAETRSFHTESPCLLSFYLLPTANRLLLPSAYCLLPTVLRLHHAPVANGHDRGTIFHFDQSCRAIAIDSKDVKVVILRFRNDW